MATLKRVGPISAFKVGAILHAIFGLIVGVIVAIVTVAMGSLGALAPSTGLHARCMHMGFGLGLGAIIVCPLVYGVIGGIVAALSALLYNLVASWIGGLEVDIS